MYDYVLPAIENRHTHTHTHTHAKIHSTIICPIRPAQKFPGRDSWRTRGGIFLPRPLALGHVAVCVFQNVGKGFKLDQHWILWFNIGTFSIFSHGFWSIILETRGCGRFNIPFFQASAIKRTHTHAHTRTPLPISLLVCAQQNSAAASCGLLRHDAFVSRNAISIRCQTSCGQSRCDEGMCQVLECSLDFDWPSLRIIDHVVNRIPTIWGRFLPAICASMRDGLLLSLPHYYWWLDPIWWL